MLNDALWVLCLPRYTFLHSHCLNVGVSHWSFITTPFPKVKAFRQRCRARVEGVHSRRRPSRRMRDLQRCASAALRGLARIPPPDATVSVLPYRVCRSCLTPLWRCVPLTLVFRPSSFGSSFRFLKSLYFFVPIHSSYTPVGDRGEVESGRRRRDQRPVFRLSSHRGQGRRRWSKVGGLLFGFLSNQRRDHDPARHHHQRENWQWHRYR